MSENPYAPPESSLADEIAAPGVDSELATLSQRFFGSLIDSILVGSINLAIMYPFGYFDAIQSGVIPLDLTLIALGTGYVVFLVLHGYLLATQGQTVGKRLVGTRIVDVETGEVPPFWRIFGLRYVVLGLATLIPFIGSLVGLIDALMIFGKQRRCAHDYIAQTQVVLA
ncbi:MAG: RDD family protein [Myxococcota bacterium]